MLITDASFEQRWLEDLFSESQIPRIRRLPDLMEEKSAHRERAKV